MSPSWDHSICDDYWDEDHRPRKGDPHRMPLPRRLEACCYCLASTKSGIYIRDDPERLGCTHTDEEE